jgi:membrane fusion protein, multidrug efflux system
MIGAKLKRFFSRAILLIVAVGLLGGMAWIVRGRVEPDSQGYSPEAAHSVTVRLYTIRPSTQDTTRTLTGVVQARYETELAFRVTGKISARLVEVGTKVSAGDPLFKLELQDYELQVESSAADLASAEATYKQAVADEARMRALKASRSVSDDEYDQALASREVAAARRTAATRALELARNRLKYTTLEAPADGVVTAIMAESGQVVADGRSVAKLTQGSEVEVKVGVPERLVAGLAESASHITYWSMPGQSSKTKLRELSPTADAITRTYEGRFTILDPPPELQLGMSATLHLNNKNGGDSISVPAGALSGRSETLVNVGGVMKNSPIVWKVVDDAGHILAVPVEVVRYGEDEVIVRGELSEGDRIVSAGVHKLDSSITIRKWEELK